MYMHHFSHILFLNLQSLCSAYKVCVCSMPLHERSLAESSARSDAPLMGMAGSDACPHQEGSPVSDGSLPGAVFSALACLKHLGPCVTPAAACLEWCQQMAGLRPPCLRHFWLASPLCV